MHWQFGEMEFGEMKRNTSNWSNFGMLLRRAGLTASAGLSCYVFVLSDLDLRPLSLTFSPPVTVVHCYISTKFGVSTAFLFRQARDGQTDGRTDRVQQLMLLPSCITNGTRLVNHNNDLRETPSVSIVGRLYKT